jgi:hypothetical protein
MTGVITTRLFHRDLPAIGPTDWTIRPSAKQLLILQAIPFSLSVLLYTLVHAHFDNRILTLI